MSPSRSCASCGKGRSADVPSRALPSRRPVAPCISITKLCRKSHKLLDRRQPLSQSGRHFRPAVPVHPVPAARQRRSTRFGQGGWSWTPKRGGTLSLRLWDPPHFDPHLTISYKTHIVYSFTHSRFLKHKAGPTVAP